MESQELALELHTLLREMDPARWRDDLENKLREKMAELQERMAQLHTRLLQWREATGQRPEIEALAQRWIALQEIVRERMPRVGLSKAERKQAWEGFRKQMMSSYNALSTSLGSFSVHVPHLRPTNYTRNLYHVLNGLTILALIQFLVTTQRAMILVSGSFFVLVWSLEIGRRIWPRLNQFLMEKVFHTMAHPHEWTHINSATWYVNALFLLALFAPHAYAAIAVTVLAFGDPAAALVGRRWGRIRLVNGRSLEGTATFVIVATLATWAMLRFFHPAYGLWASLAIAGSAAFLGSLAELFSRRIDDNLSIPLSAALGAALAASLF